MNLENLKKALSGQPNFRFKQTHKAIFVDLISDWNDNTTLPKPLREDLNKNCSLEIKSELFGSKTSETLKALITLEDDKKVETVLMKHEDGRATVCVSSQVGCPMKCSFCATGKMGYKRNLTVSEIVEQVLFWQRYLHTDEESPDRVTNVVYMGMGEPFLNYDNVMESIRLINDPDGFNIGARHISVSTCGLIDEINKFAKEKMQINLAISLHAPNDKLRSELMPINRRYPLADLMDAVDQYVENRSRQVMFEYLMIDGVNDSEYHARELAELVNGPLYMVNLIRYNPTGRYKPSSAVAIRKFKNILLREGVKVTQRHSFGTDIDAACGQLAGKKK
ncbi:23S rRNA (adenine(2503)-C(2))-methyltransferase RlmN [Candidatus Parcubacteria bacterium]|jgi:23S rRNA (adenine2503-C2)-methyltransferase|nr:23S rRNA (adenine(2503)-C(2))-methyltransferase RlmN [Candidatus Parcubacteria bacterium]MBT3948865.1 23S rRNA (adenine(2503)-C(2))-methyltransferase RlmN [Candidatus Parcubacteria bacterium]